MADLKISALPASSTPLAGTEVLPIVQSATTRQVSVANLTAGRAVSALSLTSTNDATINGITVGRGGGNVNLNTAVGTNALAATSTGDANVAVGVSALSANLGGVGNTASGAGSLRDNTSGIYNVASGYLALATNLSGASNVGIGYSVLSTGTNTSNNTAIGYEALKVTSGSTNTAIGYQSGIAMTTGTKNVILGSYSGNTGTLDIRISNNNIVLSDGDGNVRAWWDNANARFYGTLLATGITNSALTSGRVTFAGASGVLTDSANLTFNGNTLSSSNATGANAIFNSTTNVPYIRFDESGASKLLIGASAVVGGGAGYDFYGAAGIGLTFFTNTARRLDITSAGNVGIGTSNPTIPLDVYRSTFTSTTPFANQLLRVGSLGSGADASMAFSDSVVNNGYIGIQGGYLNFASNTTTPQLKLDSSGNLGLGVTPSSWRSTDRAFVIGSAGKGLSAPTSGNSVFLATNWYVSTTPANVYVGDGYATRYAQSDGAHAWSTAPNNTSGADAPLTFTQAMTLDASGGLQVLNTIGVGNTAPSTSGAGITFPATQVPSSNANTLDDYEEGTWTPTDGSGAGLSLTVSNAVYIKIGQMVYVATRIVFPTTASAAVVQINGLPFTTPAVAGGYWGGGFRYTDFNTFFSVAITPSATDFTLFKLTNTQVTNVEASGKTFDLVFMFRTTA
jgi:hypothetical protein